MLTILLLFRIRYEELKRCGNNNRNKGTKNDNDNNNNYYYCYHHNYYWNYFDKNNDNIHECNKIGSRNSGSNSNSNSKNSIHKKIITITIVDAYNKVNFGRNNCNKKRQEEEINHINDNSDYNDYDDINRMNK